MRLTLSPDKEDKGSIPSLRPDGLRGTASPAGDAAKTPPRTKERWGVLWLSENRLDGTTRHVMWEAGLPLLFETRREARVWIEHRHGYIRGRSDLRAEPHGWRMPRAVRVRVTIEAA